MGTRFYLHTDEQCPHCGVWVRDSVAEISGATPRGPERLELEVTCAVCHNLYELQLWAVGLDTPAEAPKRDWGDTVEFDYQGTTYRAMYSHQATSVMDPEDAPGREWSMVWLRDEHRPAYVPTEALREGTL